MTETDKKPSRGSRLKAYGLRRISSPEQMKRSSRSFRSAAKHAFEAVRPLKIDRDDLAAGYHGRHADGGRARFREMVAKEGLTPAQLEVARKGHLKASLAYLAAGLICVGYSVYLTASAEGAVDLIGGLTVGFLFLPFLALFTRHDFSAWQIGQARFGGFSEYMRSRS